MGCDRGTIQWILKDHLIEPAPLRKKGIAWSTFLKAHRARSRRTSKR